MLEWCMSYDIFESRWWACCSAMLGDYETRLVLGLGNVYDRAEAGERIISFFFGTNTIV